MKVSTSVLIATAGLAASSVTSRGSYLPLVTLEALQGLVTESALFDKARTLLGFAYATPQRNRLVGNPGHYATLDYIYEMVRATGYYNVSKQSFEMLVSGEEGNLTANDVDQGGLLMTYSPSGSVIQELVPVANLGCDTTDYPAEVAGKVALISRGTCPFGQKSAQAGAANAAGAVIYNNVPGELSGTLGSPPRPEGPYVPTLGISMESGTALLQAIADGGIIIGNLSVDAFTNNVTTNNILATTKLGDRNNVYQIGGHTDSVEAGPGINDDGSGTISLLDLAISLTNFSVNNAVRFSWWAGKEEGLVGSTYYTDNAPADELAKVRLYNNLDMLASPNYMFGIYDGDGSAFNLSGPPGSAEAEKLFEDYFKDQGIPSVPTEFSGRSDYQGFINNGIPAGGLFTGAEVLKTKEEAELFGGEAGVEFDVNYHGPGDTVDNCNASAWVINTKAIAHTIATYGTSFEGFPERNVTTNATLARNRMFAGGARKADIWVGRNWVRDTG